MRQPFWSAFEKQASSPAGILEPVTAIGSLIGGTTAKGKESLKVKAEAHGAQARDAAKARKNNLLQYLVNPEVPGPISEVEHRLSRRQHASMLEHPKRTATIPLYGLIHGGKAGEKHAGAVVNTLKKARTFGKGALAGGAATALGIGAYRAAESPTMTQVG